ncbi:fluoride efflux transporter CrcB [Martelella alba]|uniref:Fluoride-specific ion channel FluC n=1 Tax=Martelella alba TaxID=2590451 RepID=A0ABY2SR80_9HYPH|nr:fluoride efflux transporter CrcB [Martelella alba]TKI07840.1 fluoride efflux transporter CrcB [Martelella alba]
MLYSLIAVMIGGGVGCAARFLISMWINPLFPTLPPGTLMVNLLGGFIIGSALAFFVKYPGLDPAWKVMITTGFCGGLTTFSTFSAEIITLLQNGNYLWAITSVFTHLLGSLLMTFAGFALISFIF